MKFSLRTIKLMTFLVLIQLVTIAVMGVEFSANAVNPVDYGLQFWVGGLRIWVKYPEECHTGDSVSYQILTYSTKYSIGNYVDEMKITISTWISQTEVQMLYDAWIYQNMMMPHGFEEEKTVTVVVPENAVTGWHINFVIDVTTHSSDMLNPAETNLYLQSPVIRVKTYWELMSENNDLQDNYTDMEYEYESYKSAHSHTNYEYNSLNSSYNALQSSHNALQSSYSSLQEDYDSLKATGNLAIPMYLFIGTTIVFIATTFYFASRKPKLKPT